MQDVSWDYKCRWRGLYIRSIQVNPSTKSIHHVFKVSQLTRLKNISYSKGSAIIFKDQWYQMISSEYLFPCFTPSLNSPQNAHENNIVNPKMVVKFFESSALWQSIFTVFRNCQKTRHFSLHFSLSSYWKIEKVKKTNVQEIKVNHCPTISLINFISDPVWFEDLPNPFLLGTSVVSSTISPYNEGLVGINRWFRSRTVSYFINITSLWAMEFTEF